MVTCRPDSPRIRGFLFAAALVDSCLAATVICLSLWLKDEPWRAGPQATGLILGLPGVAYVLTTIGLGHAADRLGRRVACVVGCLLLAAGTAGLPLAPSLAGMGLLFCVQRIGAAMFWPALQGWLGSGASHAELPRRTAAFTIGWGIGYGAGSYLSGLEFAAVGAAATLWTIAGVALAAAVVCTRLPDLPAAPPDASDAEAPAPIDTAARLQAWIGIFAAYLGLGGLRALFPQYGTSVLGLSKIEVGALMAMIAGVQTLTFFYLGIVRPELASGVWLRPSQVLAVVGLLLIAAPSVPIVILGMILVGLHVGVVYAASYYRSVFGREDTSRQGGIHEAVVNSGAMLGPVLIGVASEHLAPNAGWPLAALAVLAAMAVGPRRRAVDAPETPA